jgi:hypothetical protein
MIILKNLILVLFMIICILISCEKDKDSSNHDNILGKWISIDKSDTLDFVDKTDFYKSNIDFRHDHFDYILDNDSIKIGYNGIRMVLVQPTKHKYSLNGNNLNIDFSNRNCYGFDLKVMNYIRK